MVSHDDKAGCTTVSHLETVDCQDAASVAALLERAGKLRSVGATAANERSSRSHMVFTLTVRGARASDGQQLNGALLAFLALALMLYVSSCMLNDQQHCYPCALTPLWQCVVRLTVLCTCRGAEFDRSGGERAAEVIWRQRGAAEGDTGHQQELVCAG